MRSTDEMLARLRDPQGPHRAVIRTLPGVGIRSALELFIGETSLKGLVLILVPSQVLGLQWADRLARRGFVVEILRSSSDALQLRSETLDSHPRGVLVATFARARHGQTRMALAKYRFDLLLFDGVAGGPPESICRTGSINAAKEVALVTGTSPFEWEGALTLFDMTKQDFDRATSGVALSTILYEDASQAHATFDEARKFLARFADFDFRETESASGVSLHEMLLRVATGAMSPTQPTAQERSQAWRLADQIESIDEGDGRLAALASLLGGQSDTGKWIISVVRRADAYYLRDHLHAQQIDSAVLTADIPSGEREEILKSNVRVILATTPLLTWLNHWPHGYDAIWWSFPRTRAEYESRMSLLATGANVKVFQFRRR